MDDADSADAWVLGERCPDLGGRDRLGKAGPECMDPESVGGRDLDHAIAEEPVAGDQDLVARREHAGDAHLDSGHARPEDQVDIACRLEHLAHARRSVFVESGPVVPVVRANWKRERLQDLIVHRHGPRDHQELAILHNPQASDMTSRETR